MSPQNQQNAPSTPRPSPAEQRQAAQSMGRSPQSLPGAHNEMGSYHRGDGRDKQGGRESHKGQP